MAGKAYTMREMRAIVEYLNERKAYGELKGRKMWMEFSNSNRTTRTWQSLKETFLKRILPDIQNPYYKLTMDQVRSFRQGIDIAEKERNNRLEFRTADTILNAVDQNAISTAKNDNEVPTSHENEEQTNVSNEPPTINIDDELEKVTGEDIKAAKIPSRCRSSAETLVLEYENAEDVQRVLESPNNETQTKSKSLKDMLTFEYSAPLTPLVRDLLNDFETESEASDAEPRLNIDEELPKTNNIESEAVIEDVLENIKVENAPYENDMINNEADPVIETHDTDKGDITETNGKEVETTVTKETSNEDEIQGKNENPHKNKNQDLNSKCDDNEHNNNNETIAHSHSNQNSQQDDGVTNTESTLKDTTVFVTAESNAKTFEKSSDTAKNNTDSNCIIANTGNSTQNTSSDTLLPNNQEALEDSKKETQKAKQNKTGEIVDKATKANEKRLRKRTSSRDSRDSKKQKLSDGQSKEVNNEASVPIIEIDDSSSPTDLEKDNVNKNQEKIEISSNTLTLDNTEEQINAIAKNSPENDNKQSTKAKKDIPNAEQEKNTTVVEDKNPCLVSVNLYDEQFNNTKYSDSDSDDITEKKQNTDIPQAVTDIVNDVTKQKQNTDIPQAVTDTLKEIEDIPQKAKEINEEEVVMEKEIVVAEDNKNVVRNSDSSADSELRNQGVVNNKVNESVNLQRERALANVFGFAHGLVAPTSRKRHLSHRRRSHHHRRRHSKNTDSNSSEWTSESDSESYVSPPRGRKNRHTKKYLKPKSSRILQDPEEGMLYVMFGKNVYPLVKGEKHIKKFLTYIPDSGSDEDESFWKQKYIEENKRVEEVRKLLKDAQKGQAAQRNEPTVATTSRNGTNSRSPHKSTQNRNDNNAIAPVVENKTEAIKDDKMVFKIAGKNGLEYSLEGGWYQISNAMPQVVRFLQYETGTDNAKQTPVNGTGDRLKPDIRMEVRTEDLPKADIRMEVSSGVSTPVLAAVDTEVHEKVNKLEDEIFNKIKNLEARQMEEEDKKSDRDSTNVTRRKQSRPIKESSGKSPAKRARSSKTNSPDTKQDEPKTKRVSKPKLKKPDVKQDEVEKTTETSEQQNAKQIETESTKVTEEQKGLDNKVPAISSRRTNLRSLKHREKSDHNLGDNAAVGNRTSLRLLRTPKKYDTDTSASEVKLRPTPTKEMTEQRVSEDDNARYMFPPAKTNKKSAGNNRSMPVINVTQETLGNSIDSALGYQDSDPSPMKICLPKRKRKVSFTARNIYKNKRLTRRRSCPVFSQEPSSESNNSSYFIPIRRSLSSLNSEVYRSDSYQLLKPKQKLSSKKLERIDENNPVSTKIDPDIRHFNSISKDSNKSSDNSGFILEMGSSSNVTLPRSPELSVVENMSISREMIKDANHPTINEAQQNVSSHPMDYSEYMISNMDISVPLMNQRCKLRKSTHEGTSIDTRKSESVQLKDCTVNLTLSETLDQRLRELLLESSKKTTQEDNKQTPMEVDQTTVPAKKTRARKQKDNTAMDVDESNTKKKTRAKKRSSTPQKKKAVPKSKAPQDPIIEEHVETCTAGRKSCPPVMTFIPIDENANNSSDVTLNPVKANPKKKKDIIKVKIQKPINKSRSKESRRGKSVGNGSVASTCTDSGINDTETISLVLKDCSVDLIHNHSETCLLANECIGNNSVEFVQNSPISIISLSSSRQSEDSAFYRLLENAVVLSEDTSNNLDNIASGVRPSDEVFESPETRYHSPFASMCSLLTEDLSNSPPTQPTKWYLLDEDITNTESASKPASYGSNLKQLFPIACAVPNLSTISEMSKENDDSRKTCGNL